MKLIDDWATQLRKAWSIRLAGLAATIGAYLVYNPTALDDITAMLPEPYRVPFSLFVGFMIFTTASGARLVKQGREE
jgi:hypothetical protein